MTAVEIVIQLHLLPSGNDQLSVWLLGATAGFVLAVAANKAMRSRG